MTIELITAEEAIAAIKRCAFETTETKFARDGTPACDVTRSVVHCFSGGIGCDWDTASAIEAVNNAYVHEGVPQIAWMDSLFSDGQCLHIVERVDDSGGRTRQFDTVTREDADAPM